uniref:2-(3-amino-3-carboxypropyl)histidine synthase subunit 2 n=1 Tax=Heterorhabditis bacteriophora TaxID=37862 RepID=A0A1I7XQW6_HETBA
MGLKPDNCDFEVSKNLQHLLEDFNDDDRREFFEVDDTVDWIKKKNIKESLSNFLIICYQVHMQYQNLLNTRQKRAFFCCVDEIAAAHASCDAIIHYGDACLSVPTEKVPVKWVDV